MLKKYGSDQLKCTPYYNEAQFFDLTSKLLLLSYTLVVSVGSVAAFTYMLHTRRAWALSAAGPLRSLFCKYLPVWAAWSLYEANTASNYSADAITSDFA